MAGCPSPPPERVAEAERPAPSASSWRACGGLKIPLDNRSGLGYALDMEDRIMAKTETTTHTPGPWVTREAGAAIAIARDGYIHHATVFPPDENHELREEDRANARLIAAAPEMVEALQNLVAFGPNIPTADRARALLAKIAR